MCLQMIKKYQLWIIILSFLQKKNTRKKNKYQFLFHNRKHLLSAITTILHFFSIVSVMPHDKLCFLSVLDALNCLYIIRTTHIIPFQMQLFALYISMYTCCLSNFQSQIISVFIKFSKLIRNLSCTFPLNTNLN